MNFCLFTSIDNSKGMPGLLKNSMQMQKRRRSFLKKANTCFRYLSPSSEIDCGDPSMSLPVGASFQELTSTKFHENGSFVFGCGGGFMPSGQSEDGDENVRCKSNGRWSLGTLTCLGEYRIS